MKNIVNKNNLNVDENVKKNVWEVYRFYIKKSKKFLDCNINKLENVTNTWKFCNKGILNRN